MANIKIKSSSVAGKVPLVGDLAYGELALNYADGLLFFKNSANQVTALNSSSSISSTDISHWNSAYSWGNHATAGYLTGITGTQVTNALGYTPYNSTNPNGYITSSALSNYLPLTGGTVTGDLTFAHSGTLPYIAFQSTGVNASINWQIRSGITGVANGGFSIRDTTNSANRFYIDSSGDTYSTVSSRSPVFYDSDNTGYYLNPNGTSVLYAITANSGITSGGNTGFYNNVYYSGVRNPIWSFGNATSYGISYFQGGAGIGGSDTIGIHPNGDPSASGSTLAVTYGYTQSLGSMRAPVFYDSNDTGYYIDPNSTSNSALRMRGGALFGPNTTWGANLYVGGNGNVTGNATVCTTDGNIHIDANDTNHGIYLGYYTGDYTRIYNSARSPIFYDLNDTGYYVDPNNASSLNTVHAYRFATQSGSQSPDNSHPGYGMRPFYSWNIGQAFNASAGYSNGITIGSNPGDQAYGFQIVQNMWDDRTYTRRYNSGWQSWRMLMNSTDDPYSYNMNQYVRTSDDPTFNRVYGSADIRAPIYYDLNNTGYYVDPASTSNLNALNIGGRSTTYAMFYEGFTLDANTMSTNSTGFTYSVNAPATGPIARFSTGGSYDMWLNAAYGSGSTLFFRTRNGDSGTINAWRATAAYGVNYGDSLYASIYYDANSTGYYVDPASSSQFSGVLADNWFRAQGQTGLYSQSYGQHFYPSSANGYWKITGNAGSTGGLQFYANYESALKGYVYWDGDGFGLLNGAGGWAVRTTTGSDIELYGTTYANDLRSYITYDRGDTSYYVDANGTSSLNVVQSYWLQNQVAVSTDHAYGMYFDSARATSYAIYRASGAWTHPYPDLRIAFHTGIQIGANASYGGTRFYSDYDMASELFSVGNGDANVRVTNNLYTPIVYDSNNTGYYVDPASTTNLNVLYVAGQQVTGGASGSSYARQFMFS